MKHILSSVAVLLFGWFFVVRSQEPFQLFKIGNFATKRACENAMTEIFPHFIPAIIPPPTLLVQPFGCYRASD